MYIRIDMCKNISIWSVSFESTCEFVLKVGHLLMSAHDDGDISTCLCKRGCVLKGRDKSDSKSLFLSFSLALLIQPCREFCIVDDMCKSVEKKKKTFSWWGYQVYLWGIVNDRVDSLNSVDHGIRRRCKK